MELYERLAIRDIQDAADLFRPVYDRTDGIDGLVSLEVSPYLAHRTQATIEEGRRLWGEVGRRNVMIKVPATESSLGAIEQLDLRRHQHQRHAAFLAQTLRAGRRGLPAGAREMGCPGRGSPARFERGELLRQPDRYPGGSASGRSDHRHGARWRSAAARPSAERERLCALLRERSAIANANARLVHNTQTDLVSMRCWAKLAAKGARPQRAGRSASTSVKNPKYSPWTRFSSRS